MTALRGKAIDSGWRDVAGVDHTVETDPAKHGWVVRDTPVYDAAAAELTCLAFFGPAEA